MTCRSSNLWKFFLLIPLHAIEFTMGWFLLSTGVWVAMDVIPEHPLTALLALGHIDPFAVGIGLGVLGMMKAGWAYRDFCAPSEGARHVRVALAVVAFAVWALILINGLLWPGPNQVGRYAVLFATELWTIITGARSRPGKWE